MDSLYHYESVENELDFYPDGTLEAEFGYMYVSGLIVLPKEETKKLYEAMKTYYEGGE